MERVRTSTGLPIREEPIQCLLAHVYKPKKRKIAYKLLQLMFVLARRRIAINWMGHRCLDIPTWLRDVRKWALAEETHMQLTRKDDNLQADLMEWRQLCGVALNSEGEDGIQSDSTSSGAASEGGGQPGWNGLGELSVVTTP